MQTMFRIAILASVFFCLNFLTGCDKDEAPPVYFKITLEEGHNDAAENWVILHDEQGLPQEAKQLISGTTTEFSRKISPAKFSVTILSYYGGENFVMQTFHGEDAGAQWTLRSRAVVNAGPVSGQMQIRVSDPNLGSPNDAAVSDGTGFRFELSESNVDYVKTIPAPHANLDYFISVTTRDGTPMYKFLDQPVAGTLNYALRDFQTFDQTSKITFPQTSSHFSYVLAFKEGEYPDPNSLSSGYLINFKSEPTPSSSNTLGFLNSFSNYFIFTTVGYDNYSLNYTSFAPPPPVVNLVNDINTTVTNNTWDGYSLSSSAGSYNWYSAQYNSTVDGVYRVWIVRGADTSFKNLTELPQTIQSRFPNLSIKSFTYASSSIYKSDRTYHQYLDQTFQGKWSEPYHDKYKSIY
jgi:hypothetical protein